MSDDDAGLLRIASKLAKGSVRATPLSIVQLKGGKNNRVFRIDVSSGPPLIMKIYFTDARDPRDRLAAEWRFLEYAWGKGSRCIPQPLGVDPAARAALYSFVEGRKLSPDEIGERELNAALDFVLAVNAPPRELLSLPVASEACFSITEHLETIAKRIRRLSTLDQAAPYREDAQRFVSEHLTPAWARASAEILKGALSAGLLPDEALVPPTICISPSDFGFHNALLDTAGRLVFLDFEYAGRDDPAKLACDFFCQPDSPVPIAHFEAFINHLAEGLALGEEDRVRCRLLLTAYQIKWICIILNEFLPVGAARRAFSDQGAWAEQCARQLERAAFRLATMHAI